MILSDFFASLCIGNSIISDQDIKYLRPRDKSCASEQKTEICSSIVANILYTARGQGKLDTFLGSQHLKNLN